jgi:hypothetical protein
MPARTPQQIFQHHADALGAEDIDGSAGVLRGKAGIRDAFTTLLSRFMKMTSCFSNGLPIPPRPRSTTASTHSSSRTVSSGPRQCTTHYTGREFRLTSKNCMIQFGGLSQTAIDHPVSQGCPSPRRPLTTTLACAIRLFCRIANSVAVQQSGKVFEVKGTSTRRPSDCSDGHSLLRAVIRTAERAALCKAYQSCRF